MCLQNVCSFLNCLFNKPPSPSKFVPHLDITVYFFDILYVITVHYFFLTKDFATKFSIFSTLISVASIKSKIKLTYL